ncbi:hypothetical protein [Ideonella livida]|uniref:Uncharacterized protein n=1 Tax=Ideonella livida TaxID=2707176 RepID=A0A7C9PG93_9BURK|nr:hypothetical protein [Ideonella livida]NDY90670.1 hypothetical protein [Ideonella livida]
MNDIQRQRLIGLAVLAAHVGVLLGLPIGAPPPAVRRAPQGQAPQAAQPQAPLQLLWLATGPSAGHPTPMRPDARRPVSSARGVPSPLTAPRSVPRAHVPAPAPVADSSTTAPATPHSDSTPIALTARAPEPATGSSAPTPASAPSRLTPESTRQAWIGIARQPSLATRSLEAAGGITPPSAAQRMAQAASSAGRGDCSRGEYAGAGMGLLSLPALAYAAAAGHCAR